MIFGQSQNTMIGSLSELSSDWLFGVREVIVQRPLPRSIKNLSIHFFIISDRLVEQMYQVMSLVFLVSNSSLTALLPVWRTD